MGIFGFLFGSFSYKRKRQKEGEKIIKKILASRSDTQRYTRSEVNVVVVTLKVVWRVCASTGCLYLTFSFLGDSRTHVNQITVIRLLLWRASFAHCLNVPSGVSGQFARTVLFFRVTRSFTRVPACLHFGHISQQMN